MPKLLTVHCLLSRNAKPMHSRVHFDFYQWETLLKEVEKLAAMSKNYLKKRQFYKVNSYQ